MSDEIIKRLSNHKFFEGFPESDLDNIARFARATQYEPSDHLTRSDKLADRFILIEKGDVVLEVDTHTGQDLVIQKLSAGDILGWSWLIPPHEWQFDARADEPVEVIEIDGDELRKLCEDSHELGNRFKSRLIEVLADRLTWTRNRLLGVYQETNEFEELTGG